MVFLLFTLGLEFSLPRMIAMRGEVFGLGSLQVGITTTLVAVVAWLLGVPLAVAIVLGGAVAMSSTAIAVQQLSEQGELNRTHGRLAFGTLLFQDLAVVPFLALAGVIAGSDVGYSTSEISLAVGKAAIALIIVLAAGRWLLRPLFHEIAAAGAPELFTFAVLFVAMAAAWATHAVGLSLALGAFLAGMMLAETEYRYQVESGIKPFRDTLLGLFFVTVGMQLDVGRLYDQLFIVTGLVIGLLLLKALILTLSARYFAGNWFKAWRTGIVLSEGGEFGFALLTLAAAEPADRPGDHPAGAGGHHAQHGVVTLPDPPQQVHRPLYRWRPGTARDGARPRRRGHRCAGPSRARDPLRLRPRRPERGAGAGIRRL